MVSSLAAKNRKVVLGGQGGDEIFGGYTRYLIAYFEQCIKAAINDTSKNGKFVVTYESIIPNLKSLKNYTPLENPCVPCLMIFIIPLRESILIIYDNPSHWFYPC